MIRSEKTRKQVKTTEKLKTQNKTTTSSKTFTMQGIKAGKLNLKHETLNS